MLRTTSLALIHKKTDQKDMKLIEKAQESPKELIDKKMTQANSDRE